MIKSDRIRASDSVNRGWRIHALSWHVRPFSCKVFRVPRQRHYYGLNGPQISYSRYVSACTALPERLRGCFVEAFAQAHSTLRPRERRFVPPETWGRGCSGQGRPYGVIFGWNAAADQVAVPDRRPHKAGGLRQPAGGDFPDKSPRPQKRRSALHGRKNLVFLAGVFGCRPHPVLRAALSRKRGEGTAAICGGRSTMTLRPVSEALSVRLKSREEKQKFCFIAEIQGTRDKKFLAVCAYK